MGGFSLNRVRGGENVSWWAVLVQDAMYAASLVVPEMLTIALRSKINESSCTIGRDMTRINRICCILMCIEYFILQTQVFAQ